MQEFGFPCVDILLCLKAKNSCGVCSGITAGRDRFGGFISKVLFVE
jgi:hypothetical protein